MGVSGQLKQFAKEQERKKLLCSSAPQTSSTDPTCPRAASKAAAAAKEDVSTPAAKRIRKTNGARSKNGEAESCDDRKESDGLVGRGDQERGRGEEGKGVATENKTQADVSIVQPSPEEKSEYALEYCVVVFSNFHLSDVLLLMC